MAQIEKSNKAWLIKHAEHTGEGPTGWRCKTTGELIEVKPTTRTVWDDDGPGLCTSSRGVETVVVAFCLACDGPPKEVRDGEPIHEWELMET